MDHQSNCLCQEGLKFAWYSFGVLEKSWKHEPICVESLILEKAWLPTPRCTRTVFCEECQICSTVLRQSSVPDRDTWRSAYTRSLSESLQNMFFLNSFYPSTYSDHVRQYSIKKNIVKARPINVQRLLLSVVSVRRQTLKAWLLNLSKENILREVSDLLCCLLTVKRSWRRRLTIPPIEHRVVVFLKCRITRWAFWESYSRIYFITFCSFRHSSAHHRITYSGRLVNHFRSRHTSGSTKELLM